MVNEMETEGNYKEEGIHDGNQKEEQKRKPLNLKILKAIYINSSTFQEDQDGNFWVILRERKEKEENRFRKKENGFKNRKTDNKEEKGTEELGF